MARKIAQQSVFERTGTPYNNMQQQIRGGDLNYTGEGISSIAS